MERTASNHQCLNRFITAAIVILVIYLEFTAGDGDVYKIGMAARKSCCWWDGMHVIGGAINIAMDQLRSDQVVNDFNFRYMLTLIIIFCCLICIDCRIDNRKKNVIA